MGFRQRAVRFGTTGIAWLGEGGRQDDRILQNTYGQSFPSVVRRARQLGVDVRRDHGTNWAELAKEVERQQGLSHVLRVNSAIGPTPGPKLTSRNRQVTMEMA